MITSPAQLSLAVGATHVTTELHDPGLLLTFMLEGHDVKTGNSLSVTVTVNEQSEVFPFASVALNDTEDVPIGKIEPEGKPEI